MFTRIIPFTLLLFLFSLSFSQLTKEEKKEWKKKMKTAGVEGFKSISEEKDEAESKVSTLSSKVSSLESNVSNLESDVADYKKTAKESAEKLAESEAKIDSLSSANPSLTSLTGTYFKVQIGAYKEFDLTNYFNNHKNFGGEIDDDGTMKYTLSQFSSYSDAETFKKLMLEMGVKGAWVVAYKNGKRIEMQEALRN